MDLGKVAPLFNALYNINKRKSVSNVYTMDCALHLDCTTERFSMFFFYLRRAESFFKKSSQTLYNLKDHLNSSYKREKKHAFC